MKRLILDYFRRWWWMLALGALYAFVLGWSMSAIEEFPFEFLIFFLAAWTGAVLLSYDLRRGADRAVATLPLTARQIGRSWWLATVGIPAIAWAALLFSGAGMFHHFHPNEAFPVYRLAMTSLFGLLWLGVEFTLCLSIHFPAPAFYYGNWWQRIRAGFFGGLAIWMMIGGYFSFFRGASENPFKFAILLGVGAVLTVVGWLRAGQFDPGRASLPLTARESKNPRGQHRAPGGYGGIPFLIGTTVIRPFLTGVAILAVPALLMTWQSRMNSWDSDIEFLALIGSFFSCLIILTRLISVLPQLRFFRTLPISAMRLAAVMIAIGILPFVALAPLAAGVAGLGWGTPASIMVLKICTFTLPAVALGVFLAVWRCATMEAYVLLLITTVGYQTVWVGVSDSHPQIPLSLTVPIAVMSVLLAFVLTRRALMRSSHPYRIQARPFGMAAWGMGQ